MGQMERGLNRIYGVERDRPAKQKYSRALLLAVTVGPPGCCPVADRLRSRSRQPDHDKSRRSMELPPMADRTRPCRDCTALILRFSPNRQQPGRAWLTFGAVTAVILWMITTVILAVSFRFASTFPQTWRSARRRRRAPALDIPLSARHLLRRRRCRGTRSNGRHVRQPRENDEHRPLAPGPPARPAPGSQNPERLPRNAGAIRSGRVLDLRLVVRERAWLRFIDHPGSRGTFGTLGCLHEVEPTSAHQSATAAARQVSGHSLYFA